MEKKTENYSVNTKNSNYQDTIFLLEQLEGVKKVRVLHLGSGLNERLVALIVSENDDLNFISLRKQMNRLGTDILIPEELVLVECIPEKSSEEKLFDIYNKSYTQFSNYLKPINEVEKYLVKIWGELLQVGRISTVDNFFILGGYSLQAAQMHFAIERDLKISLDFEAIMKSENLSDLAYVISKKI